MQMLHHLHAWPMATGGTRTAGGGTTGGTDGGMGLAEDSIIDLDDFLEPTVLERDIIDDDRKLADNNEQSWLRLSEWQRVPSNTSGEQRHCLPYNRRRLHAACICLGGVMVMMTLASSSLPVVHPPFAFLLHHGSQVLIPPAYPPPLLPPPVLPHPSPLGPPPGNPPSRPPATPPPAPPGAPPPPGCAWWCELNTNAWSYKCKLFTSCTGCIACSLSPPPHMPPSPHFPPAAPSPCTPPPATVEERLQIINQRYLHGGVAGMKDAGDIEGAGVLVRQFDRLDDKRRRWLPCPEYGPDSWCKDVADRWAASMINSQANHLYEQSTGGLILAPSVRLFCAYPEDGDSLHPSKVCTSKHSTQHHLRATRELMMDQLIGNENLTKNRRRANFVRNKEGEDHEKSVGLLLEERIHAAVVRLGPSYSSSECIPGCYPKGKQCRDVHRTHDAYSCSFPPEELELALRAQQGRESFRVRNNEMVVQLSSVTSQLPHSIEAFFYPTAASESERQVVEDQHSKFLEAFKLEAATGPPLLELNLGASVPFSLAAGEVAALPLNSAAIANSLDKKGE